MSICYDPTGFPEPCGGWDIYDSYVTDPRYQRYLTAAWLALAALFGLVALPSLVRFLVTGEWRRTYGGVGGLFGVQADSKGGYRRVSEQRSTASKSRRRRASNFLRKPYLAVSSLVQSAGLFTPRLPSILSRLPSLSLFRRRRPQNCHPTRLYLPFSLSTLFLFLLIPTLLLATLLPESQLRANPNRFGFLALACLPPLFLLSAKNGPVAWILGRGWTAVNFLHRWIGRAIVLLVLLHMYFWTIQYSGTAAQTAFLAGEKERRGLGALAFLLLIALSSLPPMRRFSYPLFFTLHYLGLIGFLVFLNRHTVYARNWATWGVVGIYVADMVGRVASMRIRWVEVEALEAGMTKISVRGVSSGWKGGQHLQVRVFFVPPPLQHLEGTGALKRAWRDTAHAVRSMVRPFEQHPFSIATAPPALAAEHSQQAVEEGREVEERGIELFARSCGEGSWTSDLHRYASALVPTSDEKDGSDGRKKVWLPCLFEGPYGGLPAAASLPLLSTTESILLLAGGSGMSFVLGVLDEMVGRRLASLAAGSGEGAGGGRIDVVWVVRQREHVSWFAERLSGVIAAAAAKGKEGGLRIVLRIFLTCDDSLTTAVDASPSSSASSSSVPQDPSTTTEPPPESLAALLPPSTTLHYSRPVLSSLVRETVDRALAPCARCWPVCRCGDAGVLVGGGGECANDEEGCVGCGSGGGEEEKEVQEKEEEEGEKKQGSCCAPPLSSSSMDSLDAITELPSSPPPKASCCSSSLSYPPTVTTPSCGSCCTSTSSPAASGGGKGKSACCSGAVDGPADKLDADQDERDRVEGRRLKVRTGGLGVVVCGPRGMAAELRTAVASIPLAKQVRIGGVEFHEESYGV